MRWLRGKASDAGAVSDDGDKPSLESLVARHYGFIWRTLRGFGLSREDAEDAAQQVFMIAARKLDEIAPDRARSFLYGTARHVANNARRGVSRRREVADDLDAEEAAPAHLGPEALTELVQARELLQELLDELPDELRRVLILAEIEQIEVQEIAVLEGIPAGTAASRLRRARERFRASLEVRRSRNPFTVET